MALQDSDYHYSITVLVRDESVLYCLRGLSMYAQKTGCVYKPWKTAGRKEWEKHHNIVKLHFTARSYRKAFEEMPTELLEGRWTKVGDSDEDPLPPDED